MTKIKLKKYNNQRGFTLIELLVVISIIGLLATLAVTSLNNARVKARDARRLADIDSIKKALELKFSDNSNYAVNPCGDYPNYQIANCDFSPYMNAATVHDPSGTALCTGNNTGSCDYTFWLRPVSKYYLIYFHLEGVTNLGNNAGDNCATSEEMTVCAPDVSFHPFCNGYMTTSPGKSLCEIFDFYEDEYNFINAADKNLGYIQ